MISFSDPLNLNRNLFLLKKIPLLPEKDQVNSEDFILIRLFPRQTLENNLLPKKMINLLQETKKKVEEKNLLSRFPEFDRRSIFAAALYEELAAVPAETF